MENPRKLSLESSLNANDTKILAELIQKKLNILNDMKRIKHELDQANETILKMERERTIERNKDQLKIGIKKFNRHPAVGIEYLITIGKLQKQPESVAQFLFETKSLNKTSMGIYLGDGKDFPKMVLREFGRLYDFKNKSVDISMREFLIKFRLPGEAQKIDRMMECFACRYCECNPTVFKNKDTCYILSFSIVMMNTSLHNPSVKEKPSPEQFISMNKEVKELSEIGENGLREIFERIKQEPFKIPAEDTVDNLFFNPELQGWLLKQGGRYKSWKKRWFVLSGGCLYYFEYPSDKEPKGIIPLQNLKIRETTDPKKMNCFEIYLSDCGQTIKAAKTTGGKMHEGRHSKYIMSSSTLPEKIKWLQAIENAMKADSYYEKIVAKKNSFKSNQVGESE